MRQRVIELPWTVVAADIMEPLGKSGHTYLLVMQDLFTKWIECCPLQKATGKKIREAIEELVVFRWGVPRVLLTDNSTEFMNRDLRDVGAVWYLSYNSATLSSVDEPGRAGDRILKTMITAFVERDYREWDVHINEFWFAYNSAHHTSLQAPAFFNYGQEPLPIGLHREQDNVGVEISEANPIEWREQVGKMGALQEWVAENLEAAQERQSNKGRIR
ncbi:uncharacterized protein LOC120357597 [Solenopsis invicta]|uniref:uncharacterized protein LOC120357597 n=1 Tax=Solenopsis invicta TaxID=13686 RepID=UPI00193CDFA9|nr:uncharacterized protein LOC120357597 [Solenopsis invicta]